jgi:cation:H+ antiporter
MELLFYLFVIIVCSWAVWRGGGMLESSAEKLSRYYKLPPIVQGSIITAVGSSFPELSTTILATLLHGEFELGVSAIVGSAIFNILVIPGLSAIIAGKLESDRILIYKDGQFYITSVIVLLLVFSLAVIYNPVEGGDAYEGTLTRSLALIPFLLYFLYLFLQQQETIYYNRNEDIADVSKEGIPKQWLKLLFSLAIIVVTVEGLVQSAIFLGEFFGTPNFIWGITVLAAATSVPDAVVSIRVAKNNEGLISLANVLGSNIFDLLVCIPAGILIAGSAVVDFEIAVPMMLFLTLATILLFTFMRLQLQISVTEGWILLVVYLAFIIWMVLETIGVLSYVIKTPY